MKARIRSSGSSGASDDAGGGRQATVFTDPRIARCSILPVTYMYIYVHTAAAVARKTKKKKEQKNEGKTYLRETLLNVYT